MKINDYNTGVVVGRSFQQSVHYTPRDRVGVGGEGWLPGGGGAKGRMNGLRSGARTRSSFAVTGAQRGGRSWSRKLVTA